jgi:hypothetical protein
MNRLLTALLLLVCGVSFAGEPDGVDAFLSDFYADFNGRKIERLSSQYFYPGAQAVFGEHVTALSNQDDVRAMFSAILGGLEKRGYHHSVVKNVSQTRLGENYVLASVLVDRVMADGKRIDTVCSTYSMVKVKEGWRFLAWIPTEPLPDGRCVAPVAVKPA